jgi:hypothetical protein
MEGLLQQRKLMYHGQMSFIFKKLQQPILKKEKKLF